MSGVKRVNLHRVPRPAPNGKQATIEGEKRKKFWHKKKRKKGMRKRRESCRGGKKKGAIFGKWGEKKRRLIPALVVGRDVPEVAKGKKGRSGGKRGHIQKKKKRPSERAKKRIRYRVDLLKIKTWLVKRSVCG